MFLFSVFYFFVSLFCLFLLFLNIYFSQTDINIYLFLCHFVFSAADVPQSFLANLKDAGLLSPLDKKVNQAKSFYNRRDANKGPLRPDDPRIANLLKFDYLTRLSKQQQVAVVSALTNRLTLIQGEEGRRGIIF